MFGLEPVTVDLTLYTDSLVVKGSVSTTHRRITDILNLTEPPFLVLERVTVEELGLRTSSTSVPFAQLSLDAILFAVADLPVEPDPLLRVVKSAEQAVVVVPPFSVAGNVHLVVGDGDVRDGLLALTEKFIPVTEATFWSDQLNEGRRHAAFVAINHHRLHYIAPHHEVDPWADLGQVRDGAEGEILAAGGPSVSGEAEAPPALEWPAADSGERVTRPAVE
jgi:hypothetical protein